MPPPDRMLYRGTQPDPPAPESDDALLRWLAEDPKRGLGALYDRYAGLVYGLARAMLASTGEAEDLTQEVFIGLLAKCRYDPARGTLAAFLITVTRSRALDRLRAHGRKRDILRRFGPELAGDSATPHPLEHVASAERSRSVRRALTSLPENQRQVLELAYFGGLSQTEIADRLQAPLGTVKTWARRGLFALRDALKDVVG